MHRQAPLLAIVPLLLAMAPPARAKTFTVHPGESIQAAINIAPPHSTIVVLPGTYHETGWPHAVTVTRDDIRLIARSRSGAPVVIEKTENQENGVWVSPSDSLTPEDAELPPCGPSGARIRKSRVEGFSVRGFPGYGIFLACVDGFLVRKNTVETTRTYSIFPVRSSAGRVTRNTTSGTYTDACVYVGESDNVLVDHNSATDCQIGLQIENTRHVRMIRNRSTQNTAGLIVDVITGRQTLTAEDNVVARNFLADNNRPSTGEGSGTEMLVPGIGVVIDGADRTLLTRNIIQGHSFVGMTLVDYCIGAADDCAAPGFAIDPSPDGNRVIRNRFSGNVADVIFLPVGGVDNCFARNSPDPLAAAAGAPLPACPSPARPPTYGAATSRTQGQGARERVG